MKASARCAAVLLLALTAACGASQPRERPTSVRPEPLRPPSALPYDFMWRQRVTAAWPTGKQSFEAVLQKRGGELSMVGLSALGLPGFVLTLRANGSLDVQNRMGRALPFEPSYILADVERVFFPWLSPVRAGFSGERAGEVFGLSVRERYTDGRLVRREFKRLADKAAGTVRIDYVFEAGEAADAPRRVLLDNGIHRYRLEIETFEQSRL